MRNVSCKNITYLLKSSAAILVACVQATYRTILLPVTQQGQPYTFPPY